MPGQRLHRSIFTGLLYLEIASIPFSRIIISMCIIGQVLNWMLEGNFENKWQRFKANPGIGLLASFYLAGVLGAIHSTDSGEVIKYLRVSLPLLGVPLVVGTSAPLGFRHIKYLVYAMAAAVLINLITSGALFFGLLDYPIRNFREYAFYCSHIRLSLYVIISILGLVYLLSKPSGNLPLRERIMLLILLPLFTGYLFFLKSLAGIAIFLFIAGFLLLRAIIKMQSPLRYPALILIFILPIAGLYGLYIIYQKNFQAPSPAISQLPEKTANKRPYSHSPGKHQMENGNYVWITINKKELQKAWNKRSTIPYKGKDQKGQNIYSTLIRYLASLGLPRDSTGVSQLKQKDIRAIEKGYTNYIFKEQLSLYPRVYSLLQEIYNYRNTGVPQGTLTRRIAAYKAAWNIIGNNLWFGKGTGDVKSAYKAYYQQHSQYGKNKGGIYGHNQYLRYMVMLGLTGILWFLIAFPGSWIAQKGWRNLPATIILIILLISMLSEDTLRGQRGIALFLYSFSLTLFHRFKVV